MKRMEVKTSWEKEESSMGLESRAIQGKEGGGEMRIK